MTYCDVFYLLNEGCFGGSMFEVFSDYSLLFYKHIAGVYHYCQIGSERHLFVNSERDIADVSVVKA